MGLFDRVIRKKTSRPRVFILGLDGTPYGLMQDLFDRGVLKNLAEIARQGSFLQMATTIPDVSSVAWTTFMTGVNPGRHGIFGFMDLRPGTYTTFFPNATNVRSPCIWHLIGKEGRRSVIINMPSTYPAQELNGVLIAGFVAIDLEKATFPRSLVPWLKETGYLLDVDAAKARQDQKAFFQELHTSLEKSEQTMRKLMREVDWDLFAAIVTGTDRLHHYFWDAYEEEASAYHQPFLDYYQAVDAMAGRLYEELKGEAVFLALSDHGFARLRRDFYANRWLEEHGYLAFRGDKRESVADADPARTRAFCLDPGRIYINARRRFPGGCVTPGKPCEALVDELCQALEEMTVPGPGGNPARLIRRAFRKEELFQGPFLNSAPDVVLLGEPGTNLKGATNRIEALDTGGPFTGMHTQDDAFFLCDRSVSVTQGLHILDVSKTAVTLLGSPAAGSLEGRVLLSP